MVWNLCLFEKAPHGWPLILQVVFSWINHRLFWSLLWEVSQNDSCELPYQNNQANSILEKPPLRPIVGKMTQSYKSLLHILALFYV